MNEFGTNVDVLGSWKPSPIDLSCAEINSNWEDVETNTEWDNEQRNPPQPTNAEEEEGFQETHCSPPGASRCESHPDVEIVSFAPSQPVVPLVELSSDDEIEKPHESDDDDEEESGLFEQMETKCRAPLLEECPQHHGHKGDPGVTPGTCGAIGERAQVILVWVRSSGRWERLPPMETRSHDG